MVASRRRCRYVLQRHLSNTKPWFMPRKLSRQLSSGGKNVLHKCLRICATGLKRLFVRGKNAIRNMRQGGKVRLKPISGGLKPQAKIVKLSVCNPTFICSGLKTVGLILFFYTFSITLTFYNQRFIKSFRMPLSITMVHLVTKFSMSAIVRNLMECRGKEQRVVLPWDVYVKKLAPAGLASALDIGLSNWSFEFITVSLYTMTKSTSIVFILMFALLLKLEKWRWSLVFVVLFISTGLFMFTYHSTQFDLEGFLLVLAASVISGIRWTLAQVVTQKKEIGLSNPIDMMYHIQPWMLLGLMPLCVIFEGLQISTSKLMFAYTDTSVLLQSCGLLLIGALLAFMLEFSEYLLLSFTSGLTLSITGVFKECCTLYLAHLINHDQMNTVNAIGLIVCLMGICLHVLLKAVATYGKDHYIEKDIELREFLIGDDDRPPMSPRLRHRSPSESSTNNCD